MLLEIVAVLSLVFANLVCYACHDKSVLRTRWKGPKLLFISNRSLAMKDKYPTDYWALQVLDPQHLVTSPFLNEVSVLLLRVFSLVFFGCTLLLEGLTGDGFGNAGYWFTFFTNWTFLLFGLWSVGGVVLTSWTIQKRLNAARPERGSQNFESEEIEAEALVRQQNNALHYSLEKSRKMGVADITYLLVTEVVATATLFLSFFYWTFLFSPKAPIQIDNLMKHGVNNLVFLLEIFLCRVPFVSFHYQVVLFYGSVYTLFMWIYHAASLRWVYWVLDWSKPTAVGLYLLNPLFLCAAFLFW